LVLAHLVVKVRQTGDSESSSQAATCYYQSNNYSKEEAIP